MFDQVILDGANGGFGRAILTQIKAKRIIILTSKTAESVGGKNGNAGYGIPATTALTTVTVNYLDPSATQNLSSLFDLVDPTLPLLFISNAGTLSSLVPIGQLSFKDVEESSLVNCSIPFYITSMLVRKMDEGLLTICNVSSLCAIQATTNMR
jgi:short-subunit dehydrogenase